MRQLRQTAVTLLLVALLGACGQAGPLYLPDAQMTPLPSPSPAAATPAPAPQTP